MNLKNSNHYLSTMKLKKTAVQVSKNVYIIDFLNIFSDFREMKYLKENVDFHDIKHNTLEKDTFDFFDMFFNIYLPTINVRHNNRFIFVLKNLDQYYNILTKVLNKYIEIDMRFITIENTFNDNNIDKSKDDFLCQYFYFFLSKNPELKCHLISTDLYRDRFSYIKDFKNQNMDLGIFYISPSMDIKNEHTDLQVNDQFLLDLMIKGNYRRFNIPKYTLLNLL